MLVIVTNSISQEFGLGDKSLENYDFSRKNSRMITLPKKLNEISGLAVTDDNRLFTHNDEAGIVYEIDIAAGEVIDEFQLGEKKLKKDFEGIAAVGDSLFMVTSSGVLYRFSYLGKKQNIKYKKYSTFLTSKYNVEGLSYDKVRNVLLLACKGYAGKKMKNYKAVYAFNLNTYKLTEQPEYLIDLDTLKNEFNIENFSPSGIEINPVTGNLFILSSHEKTIIVVSQDGIILNVKKLKTKQHPQPEGITFLTDNTMVISDEARDKKAMLTLIPFNP